MTKSLYRLALTAILVAFSLCAGAQQRVRFAYDATLDSYFDNIENDGGGNVYGQSMTIFGARITPEIGFNTVSGGQDGRPTHHSVMLGVNIMKDFGSRESLGQLFKEMTLYYRFNRQVSEKCEVDIHAGIFPRTAGKGEYSEVFFSDSLRFYDPNHEGLLFGFTRPNSKYEIGVDWLGQYGTDANTREKFMIFTSGKGKVLPWVSLGYSGYMLHYANSREVRGLVDNILGSMYAEFDFGSMAGMQKLAVTVTYIQALQRDRIFTGKFTAPMGGELTEELRHWNVGLRNKTYFGYSLMPYYNNVDAGGVKYGNSLYHGSAYYRVAPGIAASMDGFSHLAGQEEGTYEGKGRPGIYDRLEVYWEPRLAAGLYFKVAAIFHFNGGTGAPLGFSGCNQVIALRFNLSELMESRR